MVFSSLIFLFVFLPACLLVYYLLPSQWLTGRNFCLLLFSLGFYFYGEPRLIWVMLLSISLNYFWGRLLKKPSKLVLSLGVISNLGLLGFFKYYNFAIDTINPLFAGSLPKTSILMPIGISFFTFQAMSYLFDVYRQDVKPQTSFINLALYIAMFPQLIAGPIVRYSDVNQQLAKRQSTITDFSLGIRRFIFGLAKKVLIANPMALMADTLFNQTPDSIGLAWFGAIVYALQIYFDFSGYSDMAIGLGKLFGLHFLENFNYPYISQSITDFWRRWHISLSGWFRDYVYIPLGGNRRGPNRQLINILIVWLLTGLWHGAAWNFVLWGGYYALILIIEKRFLLNFLEKLPSFFRHLYALILILIGWVFFRSNSLPAASAYLSRMFDFSSLSSANPQLIYYLHEYSLPLCFGLLLVVPLQKPLQKYIGRFLSPELNTLIISSFEGVLFLLSVMTLVTSGYNPFIYFRF